MAEVEKDLISKVSEKALDSILNNVLEIKTIFKDVMNYNKAKQNYLNKISSLQYVKTINEFEDSVSLYDFFVEPYVANLKDKEKFVVKDLKDIKSYKKILISGIVGQGKSILMRHLAINEVLNNRKIPLFFELRYLEKGQALDKAVKRLFNEWLDIKSSRTIEYILEKGLVTLFFDGFDEIHIDDMPKIVKDFELLERKYPNLNFVVSSRPEVVVEACTIFQNFQIQKLDSNSQRNIVKALVKDEKIENAIMNGIKKSTVEVRHALITPLMINLFVFIYKQEQILPESSKDFYERLFDLVLRKHDNTKIDFNRERASKLDNNMLLKTFQLISYMCCKKQVFAFDDNIFRRIVSKAIDINGLDCSVDDLIFDLTSVLCFIVKEGYLYAFIHKSIPEFFAAQFIKLHGESGTLYKDIEENYDKYRNVCSYLREIDEYNFLNYFFKDILLNSYKVFERKDFINRSYFAKDLDVINIRIIFDDFIHEYFRKDLLDKLYDVIQKNNAKGFKDFKGFQLTISVRRLSESIDEQASHNDIGVQKGYYDSVIQDNTVHTKSNIGDIEDELVRLNYKKISSPNNKEKFSFILAFLNTYVSSMKDETLKINEIIARHRNDDYNF
ncbi:NACHT domain-containing protein [Acinetobacter junii]|uniref:NACHT domain-containing protein n=1 Tax=Acinetobacter junii TaxID=40215 RepID=UPI00057B6159|nr:NACHT domain-containing protein [Acinetobacter junii]